MRDCNHVLTSSVQDLAKGIEFWPFNESKRQVSYNDEGNQSFNKDCCIKRGCKDLKIELLSVAICLSLAIKLSELLLYSFLVFT
jgi:hypothetical protein